MGGLGLLIDMGIFFGMTLGSQLFRMEINWIVSIVGTIFLIRSLALLGFQKRFLLSLTRATHTTTRA